MQCVALSGWILSLSIVHWRFLHGFSWLDSSFLFTTELWSIIWFLKVTQSYPTLCDPMNYTVHGIFQARILEWVAFPSPGDLPNPGVEPRSPALQADSLPAEPQGKPIGLQCIYPSTCWRLSWLLQVWQLWTDCSEHLFVGFYVDIIFQFIWVNTKECDWLIVW